MTNSLNNQKVAVIGASGVVGRALMEQLQLKGESVVGLSRRPPVDLPSAQFIPLDLQDADQCSQTVRNHLSEVTHVVYTALYEKPGLIQGWRETDQMQTNLTMLQNLLKPLTSSKQLRHVTLLQGTKAYGAHVTPMRIPGREREPRHNHENFYWLQQDYLSDICTATGWQHTIWRPQVIFGHALHAPMNMLTAIGVYAGLQKAQGLPLTYPGGPSSVTEAIDADLLARAISYSFDNEDFAGETFNITNGDVFRFQDIWPALADMFEMETGTAEQQLLAESFYTKEATWQDIVTEHRLQPYSIKELVGDSFYYTDALLNAHANSAPPPALLSTIKLRQAGFNECIDTEIMFSNWYHRLRALKILPAL